MNIGSNPATDLVSSDCYPVDGVFSWSDEMPSIVMGPHVFGSKKDAKQYMGDLLSLYQVGHKLIPEHFWIAMSLIKRHPESEQKVGVGIRAISVEKHPEFRTKCLVIHREDGTTTDFSYITCIDARTKPDIVRFLEAMRYAVKEQILRFKWSQFGSKDAVLRCQITGEAVTWHTAHIDHVKPFREIAQEFIDEMNIEVSTDLLTANADNQYFETISDRLVYVCWLDYHEKHAVLRVVSDKANLRRKRGDD